MSSPSLDSARAALAKGDPRSAFTTLRAAAPDLPSEPPTFDLFVALFVDVLGQLGGAEEVALGERLRATPDDREIALQIGLRLLEAGIEELSLPFLARAHALDPLDTVAPVGLAQAWAALLAPARGLVFLHQQLARPGFEADLEWWVRFHTSALLAGEPDAGLARFCGQVRREVEAGAVADREYGEQLLLAIEDLHAMHVRFVATGDRAGDLRPWHFIQYGSALLFTAPRSGGEASGGRFCTLQLSATAIAGIVRHLVDLLGAIERTISTIVPTPGRDAAIVAELVGRLLDRPVVEVPTRETLPHGALVVAASAQSLIAPDDLIGPSWRAALRRRTTESGLFALTLDWRRRAPFCPDVVGLLAQRAVLPWSGEALAVDPANRRARAVPADERSPSEIAAQLASIEPTPNADWPAALAFYRGLADKSGLRSPPGSVRGPFVKDSPVSGSYFF